MLTAKDIMTREVITLTPQSDIIAAARLLIEKKINGVPVIDDAGVVVGILSQADLVAQQKALSLPSVFTILDGFIPLGSADAMESEVRKISAMTVGQAMTRKVVSARPDTPVSQVAAIMVDKRLYTIPVLDGDTLVGVIGKGDVLKTLLPRS